MTAGKSARAGKLAVDPERGNGDRACGAALVDGNRRGGRETSKTRAYNRV
jgi:hypothetical protein